MFTYVINRIVWMVVLLIIVSITAFVVIELPLFLWALIRGSLPPVETFDSHRETGGDAESAKVAA